MIQLIHHMLFFKAVRLIKQTKILEVITISTPIKVDTPSLEPTYPNTISQEQSNEFPRGNTLQ